MVPLDSLSLRLQFTLSISSLDLTITQMRRSTYTSGSSMLLGLLDSMMMAVVTTAWSPSARQLVSCTDVHANEFASCCEALNMSQYLLDWEHLVHHGNMPVQPNAVSESGIGAISYHSMTPNRTFCPKSPRYLINLIIDRLVQRACWVDPGQKSSLGSDYITSL